MGEGPSVVDLFCGGGGLSHGFQSAGFDVLAGVDDEPAFEETYRANHEDAAFLSADLHERSGTEVLAELGLAADAVDGVVGGPPCQGFSLAQANPNPGDQRNFLVTRFIESVYEIDPDWFLMENVPTIATMEDGAVREYVVDQFEKIGYEVTFGEVNSVSFGVPQTRRRAFFVGCKDTTFEFPEGDHRESAAQTTLGGGTKSPPVTVGDALSDLPALDPGEERSDYATEPATEYQRRCRGDAALTNHRAPNHGERVVGRIRRAGEGEKIPYDSWSQKRRLAWDDPAPTLLGGPRPTYHFAHPEQDRGLSVRERARIQSFPDGFEFHGPVTKQRQMTGNAVPPLVARAIATAIREQVVAATRGV
ncbi:DNA cytosine methyltransferase [Haloarcula litorea]|uniref:DNA cytosine methyltransferase n=1 Tax=Haloarcula litorea TaxID=3032579 RepID=UPI0023E7DCDC|nr:DNA cytosine methyltransferase [Halomicroarcula sp. GDY20]